MKTIAELDAAGLDRWINRHLYRPTVDQGREIAAEAFRNDLEITVHAVICRCSDGPVRTVLFCRDGFFCGHRD
jgi:hypothetical protein